MRADELRTAGCTGGQWHSWHILVPG
jgi:hypothetical protein